MLSMTGYGRGTAEIGTDRMVVEIKSVNHRFLEVRCRAPREILLVESLGEKLVRERIARGYCTVNIWYEGVGGDSVTIDKEVAANHLKRLIEIGDEMDLCLADLIPVLAGAPNLFASPKPLSDETLEKPTVEAFKEALDGLVKTRRAEGKALGKSYSKILRGLEKDLEKLAELAEAWPKEAFDRISARLSALLEKVSLQKVSVELDPGRVEAEVAALVDKSDINEEIIRLRSHLTQMGTLVKSKVPVGRQAEFLVQEFAREMSTIASKAGLTEIRSITVKMKTELEKIRELVQNIE